jgi:hypothetical protein
MTIDAVRMLRTKIEIVGTANLLILFLLSFCGKSFITNSSSPLFTAFIMPIRKRCQAKFRELPEPLSALWSSNLCHQNILSRF